MICARGVSNKEKEFLSLAAVLGLAGLAAGQLFPLCLTADARVSQSKGAQNPSSSSQTRILSIEIAPLGQPLKGATRRKIAFGPMMTEQLPGKLAERKGAPVPSIFDRHGRRG